MEKKATMPRLLALAKTEWKSLSVGTLFLFLAAGLNLSFPMLIGQLIEGITTEANGKAIVNKYVTILLIVFFFAGIATFLRSYLFTVAGERIVTNLRQMLFSSLISQEVAFFDEQRTGALTNRLASDTTVIQNAVTVNISMGLRFGLSALGSIVILMYISWKLTLLMLAIVPVVAGGAGFYGRSLRKISIDVQDALARCTAIAEESFSGIRTVRAFAREKQAAQTYGQAVEKAFQIAKKRAFLGASFQGLVSFCGYGAICAVLWYGGILLVEGAMSFGTLTSFILYTFSVAFSIGAMGSLYEDFAKALGASERVFGFLHRQSDLQDGPEKPTQVKGNLTFRDVSFAYPTRQDVMVLNDFNLLLKEGDVVALVGPSGGGKSTVAALSSRFYDPQNGMILLDEIPLPQWNKNSLRRQIGVVSQEPILFATSIEENIRYGKPTATKEDIVSAAKAANAHNFISAFPEGYQTTVGERGVRLSGGQKQRVAIARALLKDPAILILDEATSALDVESEHLVQEALERLMKNRTTLIIAHRLSTIQEADRIAVIDAGKIVEQGSHQDLLEKKGVYHRLIGM